jgi:hypothetical protein
MMKHQDEDVERELSTCLKQLDRAAIDSVA